MALTSLALGFGSALPGILGGIFGKGEHDKYAELLMQQELTMPRGITGAEEILGRQSQQGLIGKDIIEGGIEESFSDIMRTAKTVADSPSALTEALIQGQVGVSGQKRKLGVEDAAAKAANLKAFSNFLANVKAPAEQRIQEFEINKILGAQREKMAGTQDLFAGISGGIGGGLSAYGMGEQTDYMRERGDILSQYWGG